MSGAAARRPPPAGKPPRKGGGAGRGHRAVIRVAAARWWRRPLAIAAILAGLFLGFPLAQALFGDIGALMLGCVVAGFALGRATA